MSHGSPSAVLIAGPTASGKSALALALAAKLDGVIINADSMQVYRDLRIITARPTEDEEQRAPHRLYGHVDAAENYSTGRWLKDLASVVDEVRSQNRLPILAGGTGLYFKALSAGLAAIPPIPAQIRRDVRASIEQEGAPALHAELMKVDPPTAQRLMPNDRSRIGRALEVFLATGRPLSDWHREGMPPPLNTTRAVKVFLKTERATLVNRIQTRFDAMLQAGALDEVRALASRHLDPTLPAMKAHGVPWLIRHIRGEISLEQAAEGSVMDTRRYARRQLTWFRNQLSDWPWIQPEEATAVVEKTLAAAK